MKPMGVALLLFVFASSACGQDKPTSFLNDPAALVDPSIIEAEAKKAADEFAKLADAAARLERANRAVNGVNGVGPIVAPLQNQAAASVKAPIQRKRYNKVYPPHPMAVWQAAWRQQNMAAIRTPYVFVPGR